MIRAARAVRPHQSAHAFSAADARGRNYRERTIRRQDLSLLRDEGRRLGSVWSDCPGMRANTPLFGEATAIPPKSPRRCWNGSSAPHSHPDTPRARSDVRFGDHARRRRTSRPLLGRHRQEFDRDRHRPSAPAALAQCASTARSLALSSSRDRTRRATKRVSWYARGRRGIPVLTSSAKASSEVGSARVSRFATFSTDAPSKRRLTGTSSFFPFKVRGTARTAGWRRARDGVRAHVESCL